MTQKLTTRIIIIIITRATGPRAQWAIPFPHLLRERTGNRAKGLERVYMASYSNLRGRCGSMLLEACVRAAWNRLQGVT